MNILEIIQGYNIPLQIGLVQMKIPYCQRMNAEQSNLINQEVDSMLHKGIIQRVPHFRNEFVSNAFSRQ